MRRRITPVSRRDMAFTLARLVDYLDAHAKLAGLDSSQDESHIQQQLLNARYLITTRNSRRLRASLNLVVSRLQREEHHDDRISE